MYKSDEEIITQNNLNNVTKICRNCNQRLYNYATKCPRCGNDKLDAMTIEECKIYIENAIKEHRKIGEEIERKKVIEEQKQTAMRQGYSPNNIPKCPTCGSTNITKISTTSKVAGAVAFGLFSKTARSQFKCNNCGYKW